MRAVSLTSGKGGIQRFRDRAGAKPDTFYDLTNAYVTQGLGVVPRPGAVLDYALPDGTVGLTAFAGKKVVYAIENIALSDPSYELVILKHPTLPSLPLIQIHFAEPFLGYLYVVAEFGNGDVFHYWLQPLDDWAALTVYLAGTTIQPTEPNGYGYRANRIGAPNPNWAANVPRQVGDRVEPTVPNGYYYEVVEVFGANPSSGPTEPVWPAEEGSTVEENVDGQPQLPPPTVTPPTDGGVLPPGVIDRYGPIRRSGIDIDNGIIE